MDSQIEIIQLRDRISELEREKAEVEGFAAVAAHELLTPVVMIDACAATLSDRLADESHAESRRDLAVLRRGCAQSRLLVECLLHQAAFRDRPLQTRRVELDGVVGDCVALLGPEIRARGAQVHVDPLPAVDVEAPLICAVFMNLLVNALKYARHGYRNRASGSKQTRCNECFARPVEAGLPRRHGAVGLDYTQ